MSWLQSLLFIRDNLRCVFVVFFGRLLPKLQPPVTDLAGKVAIVTGANSGIGLSLVEGLATRGATVYLACRSKTRAEAAIAKVLSNVPAAKNRLLFAELDIGNLQKVRSFAHNWSSKDDNHIDLVFHNAGWARFSYDEEFSAGGIESTYAVNFLGSFLLTYLLEGCLAPTARVIFTTSNASYAALFENNFQLGPVTEVTEGGFHYPIKHSMFGKDKHLTDGQSAYGNTKAMQVIFAKLLQDRFDTHAKVSGDGSRRIACSFSPGFTKSAIQDKLKTATFEKDPTFYAAKMVSFLASETDQGSATGIWLACSQEDLVVGKQYAGSCYERMTRRVNWGDVADQKLMDRMWVRWERDAGIEWR